MSDARESSAETSPPRTAAVGSTGTGHSRTDPPDTGDAPDPSIADPRPAEIAALPPDRLHCPSCGYGVYGLPENRCPECGKPFTWEQVRVASLKFDSVLFEHQWYHDPVPALLRTWGWAAFRPFRLWASYDIHERPRVWPLIFFVALQYVLFAYGWRAGALVIDPLMNHIASLVPDAGGRTLRFIYPFRLSTGSLHNLAVWHLATFVVLLLFFEPGLLDSVERKLTFSERWRHLLRVYAHATAFAALCTVAWCVLEAFIDASLYILSGPPSRAFANSAYRYLGRGILYLAFFVTWIQIWFGYRRYLRMPLGWAVATVSIFAGWVVKELIRLI